MGCSGAIDSRYDPLGLARAAAVVGLAAEDERDERLLDASEAPAGGTLRAAAPSTYRITFPST